MATVVRKTRNKDKQREYDLKRHYNITKEDRDLMLLLQGNKCAICYKERPLNVDHCHTTGRVRGLLCSACNKGLGYFEDSTFLLAKAAQYLGELV